MFLDINSIIFHPSPLLLAQQNYSPEKRGKAQVRVLLTGTAVCASLVETDTPSPLRAYSRLCLGHRATIVLLEQPGVRRSFFRVLRHGGRRSRSSSVRTCVSTTGLITRHLGRLLSLVLLM